MEQVTLCSKGSLSELEHTIRRAFSTKEIGFQRSQQGMDALRLARSDLPELSEALADWINQSFCHQGIREVLYQKYDILSGQEKARISCAAVKKLKAANQGLVAMIQKKLITLFEISDKIQLEGFVTFCLQEYRSELELLVDECLDEYLAEQDYLEFLELLRYFVEVEGSQFGCLAIVVQPDGSYRYYGWEDETAQEIDLNAFLDKCTEAVTEPDDQLIGLLISLLPEEIALYGAEYMENKNLLKTLQIIFEERFCAYPYTSAPLPEKHDL